MRAISQQLHEPSDRLRVAISTTAHDTLNLMLGAIDVPADQPFCATAIGNCASAFICYGKTISNVRQSFQLLLTDAEAIAEAVVANRREIEGLTPAAALRGRKSKFVVWSLLSGITADQEPLMIALGAEVAWALLNQSKLNIGFCKKLLHDLKTYGRPGNGIEPDLQDLEELEFGRTWILHFRAVDQQIRRRVELTDPNGPKRKAGVQVAHRLDILNRIRQRFEYPNIKHRQAAIDDSHVTMLQFKAAGQETRSKVEAGSAQASLQSVCVLTELSPELAASLPLVTPEQPLNSIGIDLAANSWMLDLRTIFPNRKKPTPVTQYLFHASTDFLTNGLPDFLTLDLRERAAAHPNAQLLGDVLDWPEVRPEDALIMDEVCRLNATLARVSKTAGPAIIASGCNRIVAAAITADFSLCSSSRMYYSRLLGEEVAEGDETLFDALGWERNAVPIPVAAGTHCQLTNQGVQTIFEHLRKLCESFHPGRNSRLDRLVEHHNIYTQYTAALLSFCMAMRGVQQYRLLACELIHGQNEIVLHDKQGGDKRMAMPVPLNNIVKEQIRQYLAHGQALVRRFNDLSDKRITKLIAALESALNGDPGAPLLVLASPRLTPVAVGSANVWGNLPKHLRVPANVGRHFWQNAARQAGLSSHDIDRLMRHRVVGLEPNTNSQIRPAAESFDRICELQDRILTELGIKAISGLRRAST